MTNYPVSRQQIIDTLLSALEPQPYVYAIWQQGAASFDRVDDFSDIDMIVIAGDERTEDVLQLVEAALKTLSPIEYQYRIPEPAWHGHSQVLYRLKDASPFHMVDFLVQKVHTNSPRFWEEAMHGKALLHVNKNDTFSPTPFDLEAHFNAMIKTLDGLKIRFPMLQILVLKEFPRNNPIEAFGYYYNFTLRPLLQVLQMKYTPIHYDFGTRYVYYELPEEVALHLESFYFVPNLSALKDRQSEAEEWFNEVIADLTTEKIRASLGL